MTELNNEWIRNLWHIGCLGMEQIEKMCRDKLNENDEEEIHT